MQSIPSVVDGLKPTQRKILYSCLKVCRFLLCSSLSLLVLAQFDSRHQSCTACWVLLPVIDCTRPFRCRYVSEQTNYHHGESSLHSTIVNLGQDFVGANNLPLLVPSGMFGTREKGGKDAASARYIFTRLDDVTRAIFKEQVVTLTTLSA